MDKINNIGLARELLKVYDFDGFTSQEVWSRIAQKINIIIEHFNYLDKKFDNQKELVDSKLNYLLNEGLTEQVSKKIIALINDGTIGELINGTLLKEINEQLDTIEIELPTKRDKSIPIKSSDLDISSDEHKIKPINCSDELIQMINGNAPTHQTIPNGGVTLEKLADGENYEKQMGFYSDTIDSIDFTVADKSIKITIKAIDNSSSTLYRMSVNGKNTQTIAIPHNSEFTISNWGTLIWDYNTTTIKTVSWNEEIAKNSLVLLVNSNGMIKDGYFINYINKFNFINVDNKLNELHYIDNINKVSVSLENPKSFYMYNAYSNLENDNYNGVFFKFDGLLKVVVNNTATFQRYYDVIYSDIPQEYKHTSHEWVEGCVAVPQNYRLVLDCTDWRFKIVENTVYNSKQIILIENENGQCSKGEFLQFYVHQLIQRDRIKKDTIPLYYNDYLYAREYTILDKETENTFNFVFTTDNHPQEEINGFPMVSHNILNRLDNRLNLEFVLDGGDIIPYGMDNKHNALKSLRLGANKFKNKYKYFIAQGNHDTNGKSEEGLVNHVISNLITQREMYTILGKHHDNNVVWGSKEWLYYYKDFEDKKIRLIVLNNSDVPVIDNGQGKTTIDILNTLGMRQEQVNWLGNTALKFDDKVDKNEWEVIILSHYFTAIDEEIQGSVRWNNQVQVHEILKAFVSGTKTTQQNSDSTFNLNVTVDFTSQGAKKIIGYFCGHNHFDFCKVIDGIPFISSQADYKSNWGDFCPTMIQGTTSEIAFDIITLDKKNKNVKLTRIGAGNDREYNY